MNKAINFRPTRNPRLSSDFTEIEVTMTFKNDFATKLITEAEARKTTPIVLLADVLEIVVNDNLWTALLDK